MNIPFAPILLSDSGGNEFSSVKIVNNNATNSILNKDSLSFYDASNNIVAQYPAASGATIIPEYLCTYGKTSSEDGKTGVVLQPGGIDICHENYPYIDFHYGNSTADYTSRIIEQSSGTLKNIGNLIVGTATGNGVELSKNGGIDIYNATYPIINFHYANSATATTALKGLSNGAIRITDGLYTHDKTSTTDGKAGVVIGAGGIEISHASTPYIDFHYGNSTEDYTSRISESESGTISISGNLTVPSGKLQIAGNAFTSGGSASSGYIRIPQGKIQIAWKIVTKTGLTFSAWGSIYESTGIGMGNWATAFASTPAISFSAWTSGNTDVWVATTTAKTASAIGTIYLERAATATINTQTAYVCAIGVGTYT